MNNYKQQLIDSNVCSDLLKDVTCLTIDTDFNIIYCVNREKHLISIGLNENLVKDCCDLCGNESSLSAICVEFLTEERSVCIAITNGDLINYNTITNDKQLLSSGFDGLQSVSFSYDQELVVLLTNNNALILMNKLFDVLAQTSLDTAQFVVNNWVSVNWGSKSTQFHGQGMRDFRSNQQEMTPLSQFDDKKARISWRADGLYFVTSFVDSKTGNRKLQVWNREAILQYSSEYVSGLEKLISWKPSGSLIASSQILPNKHLIIFFEKNGLKHGELELPFVPNTFHIVLISWSHDSEILLVLGTETSIQSSKQVLMLWKTSNYHWYLKQSLEFTHELIVCAIWDPIDYNLLHIILNNGQYMKYRWKWSVDEFDGNVALIDGKSLKITNFNKAIVPPPFCSYCLDFKVNIVEIYLSKSSLAVVLLNDTIILFKTIPDNQNIKTDLFSTSCENMNEGITCFNKQVIKSIKNISKLTNFILTENDVIYGNDSNQLLSLDLNSDSILLNTLTSVDNKIIAINYVEDILAIVKIDGHLMKLDLISQTLNQWTDKFENPVIYSQNCLQLQLFKLNDDIIAICLTENMTLYLDNQIIANNNCNSFIKFNHNFLLFCTTDQLLHCWPINENIFDFNNNYKNHSPRSLERGSQIISASVNEAKVVLQMPRGNLETVHPRMLLLHFVMSSLDISRYDLAFELLRKHRINLNFLCDYNPDIFQNNIDLFINQIETKSIQWLNLFLTDLSNENSYVKLSSINGKTRNCLSKNENNITNKVDVICDLMRQSMETIDKNRFLHPILLTYIKKSIPEIDIALKRIKNIENNSIRDEAIKFLLYIINISTLFEEALGTYDRDILLMIASKSQKDPKEYLALLEELNVYESDHYKHYKIDLYLKRYKKALTHLSKCDQYFDECLQLITSHGLYREAIQLFENRSEQQNAIWKLYGDYLLNKRYFEESAIAYRRCNDYANAVKVYQLSGNWNRAIETALHSRQINVETLARNLANHLSSIGNHCDASYLLETYVKDFNESIIILINGHEWDNAIRLFNQHKDSQNNDDSTKFQLQHCFHKELINHFDSTLDFLVSNRENLLKYKNRLEIVRAEKLEKLLTNDFDNFDHKSDIYSDTSSIIDSISNSQKSSSSSLMTRKSKKSAKKTENKKYILKKGSRDEDIQLVFAIIEIIKKSDRMQEEISLLIKTLYEFHYIEESVKIQQHFSDLLDLINNLIKEIWISNEANDLTQKYQISDPELSKTPAIRKIDWKLALI